MSNSSLQSSSETPPGKEPVCVLVTGMAGTGKSTFVNQLSKSIVEDQNKSVYVINLDPAVHFLPYTPSVDIRDSVKYKDVQRQYGLGPNGAIVTCLNLFSTKIHELVELIEKKRASPEGVDYVIIDTPGQIEVFYWSASGSVITTCLASLYPVTVVYVMDTPLSHNPNTFMSNMLYACGILYRYRLPFIVALNKVDIIDCSFALEWMQDFETFHQALNEVGSSKSTSSAAPGGCGSVNNAAFSNLSYSLSLVLDTFYATLVTCGVSAVTGQGMGEFVGKLNQSVSEYWTKYRRELDASKKREKEAAAAVEASSSSGRRRNEEDKRMFVDDDEEKAIYTELVHEGIILQPSQFLDNEEGGEGAAEERDLNDDRQFATFLEKTRTSLEKSSLPPS